MIKTYEELYGILAGIASLKEVKKGKFALLLHKNKKIIKDILIPFEETLEQLTDDEKKEWQIMLSEIQKIQESDVSIDEKKEQIKKVEDSYKTILDKAQEINKANATLVKETVEVDFVKIEEDILPDMDLTQIESIEDLIA